MPTGLHRYQQTGDLHFLTFSCHKRLPHLANPETRDLLLEVLERVTQRYESTIDGFIVMPEHVHLLVHEPRDGTMASMIRSLKQSVAQRLAEKPFWYPRYYDFNVFTEAKRTEKLTYMHLNPVRRGLCSKPEDWRWSSFSRTTTPGAPSPTQSGEVGIRATREPLFQNLESSRNSKACPRIVPLRTNRTSLPKPPTPCAPCTT